MSQDSMEQPRLVELAPRFWVRNQIDNIAWLDCGGWALAVDALEHPELEAEVFQAVGQTLEETPIRYLLNTHTHYDHIALNEAFARRGAQVVNRLDAEVPESGQWFQGRQRSVLLLPMPGLHTPEDCIVWVPQDRVLFTGDLFGWGLIPLTRHLRADTLAGLLDAYDRLIGFDAVTVVPGHGPLCETGTLRRYVRYVTWLVRRCDELVRAGADDERILQELQPPEDMRGWWRFVEWKHGSALSTVLKSVRRGWIASADIPDRYAP